MPWGKTKGHTRMYRQTTRVPTAAGVIETRCIPLQHAGAAGERTHEARSQILEFPINFPNQIELYGNYESH